MAFRKQKSSRGLIQNWARQRQLDAEPALSLAQPACDLQTTIAQNLDVRYPPEFHRFQTVPWPFGNKSRRGARYKIGRDSGSWMLSQRSLWLSQRATFQTPIAQNLDVRYPPEFHRFQTVPWPFGNKSRRGARYKIGRDSGSCMLSQRYLWLSQRATFQTPSSKSGCTVSPRVSPISDGPMAFRKQKSSRGPIQNWARQRQLDA